MCLLDKLLAIGSLALGFVSQIHPVRLKARGLLSGEVLLNADGLNAECYPALAFGFTAGSFSAGSVMSRALWL